MPSEASVFDLQIASVPHRSFAGAADDAQRCACPVCAGAVTVQDADAGLDGLQGYLNADERSGAAPNGKTSYSIDDAAWQLVRGEPGWSNALGVGYTVTYAFRASAQSMPSDTAGFSRFNAAQIQQTELALRAWSDVANITFQRVGSGTFGEQAYSNSASMLFGNYASGEEGASAFAMYPGNPSFFSSSGDVWINSTAGSNSSPSPGNYGAHVLVHEIGHAIGLAHPGDYNADANTVFSYAGDAAYYEDSSQYTVMSYFSETHTGANFRGSYAAVPLLDDIAAAQLEYGVNWSTRTGDTTYGFNSTAERPWFAASSSSTRLIFAVWDAGGTDTLDFSGYFNNQLIDLREGFFSNVGGLTGNVAIAKGAVIENAIGGSGYDQMNGNAAANRMFGGAGGDTLSGGDGRDFLRGEEGNDRIYGGAEFDDVHGNMGNDTVYGGLGDDWVVGGKDRDLLYGEEGHDVVLGNMGDDTADGGAGNDVVRGGQGSDLVIGGAGNDWLSGDREADTLSGGSGADIFHTFAGAGVDRVTDFSIGEGDRVQLLPGQTWAAHQSGADTVVDLGGGDQLILQNVDMASLPAGWIFGY